MLIIIKIINFIEAKIEFSKFCSYGTTILNIMDNTAELWMTKYIIGEIFISGKATLYKNPSDQTVKTEHQDYFPTVCAIHLLFRTSFVTEVSYLQSKKWWCMYVGEGNYCLFLFKMKRERERGRQVGKAFTASLV